MCLPEGVAILNCYDTNANVLLHRAREIGFGSSQDYLCMYLSKAAKR